MNKFKFMVLFVAALAMFSCKSKNEPTEEPEIKGNFKSLISVTDATLDDWANIPAEYLTIIRKDPATKKLGGLDSIYVYADKYYLYLQVWYRADSLTKRDLVPFHIYLNADNNNATGGYDDYFTFGNAEWLLEGFLFQSGQPTTFNPALFMWWGALGTGIADQSNKTGWWWTDPANPGDETNGWGAIIPTDESAIGNSQVLNANKVFEIQLKRMDIINAAKNLSNQSLVSGWKWADEFTVGFDIEMEVGKKGEMDAPWQMQGVLPSTIEDEFGFDIKGTKAKVKVDPSNH